MAKSTILSHLFRDRLSLGIFMKMISSKSRVLILLFMLASATLVWADDAPNACWQTPTFVVPLNTAKVKAVLSMLSPDDREMVENKNLRLYRVYEADINNNGKPAIIFTSIDTSASDNPIAVIVFQKTAEGLQYLGEPPTPASAGDGPFYFNLYTNKNIGKDEFLTQLCGKTYMSFDVVSHRDAYFWKNNQTQDACDDTWINYERAGFQNLYNRQQYSDAFAQLDFYADKCKKQINPQLYLAMQNDLALAEIKDKNFQQCNAIIAKIENDPAFKSSSDGLKKAVAFNKNFCQEAEMQTVIFDKPGGANKYAWLLYKNIAEEFGHGGPAPLKPEFVKKFKQFLTQVVPSIPAKTFYKYADKDELSTTFYQMLEYGDVAIKDNRYVWFEGCVPHDCGEMGFIWVDTLKGTSAIGIVNNKDALYLTSRNYNASTFPTSAKKAITDWYKMLWGKQTFTLPIFFYDVEKKQKISLPSGWLD